MEAAQKKGVGGEVLLRYTPLSGTVPKSSKSTTCTKQQNKKASAKKSGRHMRRVMREKEMRRGGAYTRTLQRRRTGTRSRTHERRVRTVFSR